jgi:hypothetical protein
MSTICPVWSRLLLVKIGAGESGAAGAEDLTALPPAEIQPAVRAALDAIKRPTVEIRWRTLELLLAGLRDGAPRAHRRRPAPTATHDRGA